MLRLKECSNWILGILLTCLLVTVTGAVEAQNLLVKWESNFHFLPDPALDVTQLTCSFSTSTWQIESKFKYDPSGLIDLSFQGDFKVGSFLRLNGGIVFDPLDPEVYESSYIEGHLTLQRFTLMGNIQHYAHWFCNSFTKSYMLYTLRFTTTISNIDFITKVQFEEGYQHFTVKNLGLILNNLSFCCNIIYNVEVLIDKQGLSLFKISTNRLLDFNTFTLGAELTFTTDSKSFKFTLDIKPLVYGCITIFWDLNLDNWLKDLAIYGLQISCRLNPCSKLEFITAFDPEKVPGKFQNDEFEVIKLSLCVPGCCGYITGEFMLYFSPTGIPLGISRLIANAKIPFSEHFSLNFFFEFPETFDIGFVLVFDILDLFSSTITFK